LHFHILVIVFILLSRVNFRLSVFIRRRPACLVIFASSRPVINGNARRRLCGAQFLEVIIIRDCLTKPNKGGINNKTQKIRKSLGRRERQLTFTPFLLGDISIGVTMGKILKTSAEGRKCLFPHCTRILSIYNHKAYCHIHLDQMPQEQKKPKILTHPAALTDTI